MLTSHDKANLVYQACSDRKGFDLLCLDVQKVSSITDYFVIASGTSDRHVKAIAESVVDCLKKNGESPSNCKLEGLEDCRWVLVDSSDVMVHIFQEPVRKFYALEELWHQAKEVPF